MAKARNYADEYRKFGSSTKAKKDRAHRNKARRQAEREGKVRKGDGKDVSHKDSNPRNNAKSNIRIESRSTNRGRTRNGKRV